MNRVMILSFKQRLLYTTVLAGLLFIASFVALNARNQKIEAALPYNTVYNHVIAHAPAFIASEAANACANLGWTVFFDTWVSPRGAPRDTTVTVNKGDPSAPLQLNYVSYRCVSGSDRVRGHSNIVSTSPSIAALNGAVYAINWVDYTTTGVRSGAVRNFDFPGPFNGYQTDDWINLDVRSRGTVTLRSPTRYVCALQTGEAGPPTATTSETNFTPTSTKCSIGNNRFSIQVKIRDNPQTAYMTVTCDTISYRVSDPDGDRYDTFLLWDSEDAEQIGTNQAPSNTPGDVNTYSITNRKDFNTHTVRLLTISRGTGKHWILSPERALGPCIVPTCNPLQLTPGTAGVGQQAQLRASFTGQMGARASNIGYYGWIENGFSGATVTPGGAPTYAQAGTVVKGSTSGNSMTWNLTFSSPGTFNGSIKFVLGSSPNQEIICDGTITISDKPYLRVWGGDVSVGCDSSSVWQTGTDTGKILTFNRGSGRGSGTDLTVRALREITEFSSSQRTATADNYMTFANAGSGVPSPWGGNFGASCADSQYTDEAVNAATSLANLNAAPTTSGSYKYTSNGSATIRNWVIPDGVDITLYVDGDVTIAGQGANKAGVAYQTTTWTSIDRIPSFKLVVRGDIKVAKSADSLSGTYVAQPRDASAGGTIYTCVPTQTTFYTSSATFINDCDESLAIYGSFIAKNVKFLRVGGSTSTANASDAPGAGTAAEKFILSPELWLNSTGGSTAGGYDSLTSLPPVF